MQEEVLDLLAGDRRQIRVILDVKVTLSEPALRDRDDLLIASPVILHP